MTTPERIFAEASALRERLARATGASFAEVELEPDARPSVVALWKGLGWSKLYEECALVHPSLERGRERAFATVTAWNRTKMSKLTRGDLPEKFRVVYDDGAGVGFQIADETTAGAEPRVLGVVCDTSQIVRERTSYVRAVVLPLVLRLWPRLQSFWVDAKPASALARKKLFPTLAPGVAEVARGVFCAPASKGSTLYFERHADLFDWLDAVSLTSLEVSAFPDSVLYPNAQFDDLAAKLRDVRTLSARKAEGPVLLAKLGEQRVLIAAGKHLNASILTADRDATHALLHAVPSSRRWSAPCEARSAPVYVRTAVGDVAEQAFTDAVANLERIARAFAPRAADGTAVPRVLPSDLPERPRRVLAALEASSVALAVPSIETSNDELAYLFERWTRLDALPEDGWFGQGKDLARARRELPERGRLVFGPDREGVVLFTDEDAGPLDPPVLAVCPQCRPVHFGHPRLSSLLVALALKELVRGKERAPAKSLPGSVAPTPLAPLALDMAEPAPGVLWDGHSLYFANSQVFAAFFAKADPPPPENAERWLPQPRRKPALLPEALSKSDGFRCYVLPHKYAGGPPNECAYAEIDGAPIWITTRRYRWGKAVEILFRSEDRPRLDPWIRKKAGTLLSPTRPRLY
ncbi:MAG TPA: hypothetical protein VMI54_09940 [Polyangiaceae bacterium]|nr:hypothetical protein [Polyangiaceae bacterium]